MDDMVNKISDLENKIEKYRPRTEEEKLGLRKYDSGPFSHTLSDFFTDKEEVFDKTGKKQYILKQEDTTFIFHNAMYDVCWLRSAGVTIKGKIVDTMIAASLID